MERKCPAKDFGNLGIPREVVVFSRNSGKCCSFLTGKSWNCKLEFFMECKVLWCLAFM